MRQGLHSGRYWCLVLPPWPWVREPLLQAVNFLARNVPIVKKLSVLILPAWQPLHKKCASHTRSSRSFLKRLVIPQGGVHVPSPRACRNFAASKLRKMERPYMRKLALLAGLVFLFSLNASAQDSKVDVFVGYTFLHTSPPINLSTFNSNGGVASAALNFNSWFSGVIEVGGVHASHIGGADVDATAETVMAGPKISLFRRSSFSPFAQALFGFMHTNPGYNQTAISRDNFAFSPGVGLDWNPWSHFGIRLAQVDYLLARIPTSTNQVNWNNFRYSGGVVLRF